MKILHLAPPASGTGALTAHSFIDEEIDALARSGVECFVPSHVHAQPVSAGGVHVTPLAPASRASKLWRTMTLAGMNASWLPIRAAANPRQMLYALGVETWAADLIAREQIDLVHSHFGWPGGLGGIVAGASAGVPVVASVRGMDVLRSDDVGYGLCRDAGYRAGIEALLAGADGTVYASEFLRRMAIRAGARADRTLVVRKGVDLDRFRPHPDRAAGQRALGLDGPVILAVGTLGPLKGYQFLIDALGALRGARWTLILCGEGPLRSALEARCARHGIEDRVRFKGWVPRTAIGDLFAAADIFVHPSLLEAAGNVVLEAQAAGCATVATDCGGPAEYLVDGETGFVIPPGNAAALADALALLLGRPGLRARLGSAARDRMVADHSYARMIDDLLTVYRRFARTHKDLVSNR